MVVATVFDDDFFVHGYTMIVSLLHNTPSRPLHLYVISAQLNDIHRLKIQELCNTHSVIFSFVPVNQAEYTSFSIIPHLTQNVYYRLQLSEYLKDESSCLFLDADIIVLKDVCVELAKCTDIHTPLMAVRDIQDRDPYFNAGVMWCNLEMWRMYFVFETAKKLYTNPKAFPFCEQDLLNHIFKDTWKSLPLAFNFAPITVEDILFHARVRRKQFSKKDIQNAIQNPIIVHYIGHEKPWYWPYSRWSRIYWKYRKLALGDEVPPFTFKMLFRGMVLAIGRLYHILPERLRIAMKVADRMKIFIPKRS